MLVCGGVFVLAAFSWQYGWWRPTVRLDAPRILMYHMITLHRPKARFNKLRVEPDQFERQVAWLKEHGWTFVFMSELGPDSKAKKRVALTFDDGYRDNLLVADKVLEKWKARATLYLVVDRHGRDWSSTKSERHNDGELRREPKLLDSDVERLLQSGRWELGAHTVTHSYLLGLSTARRKTEVVDGKRLLEERFGVSVESFAYPFGAYTKQDVENVSQAGFRTAVTTRQGISDAENGKALELKRVKVSGNDGMFAFKLRMRTGKCRWKD